MVNDVAKSVTLQEPNFSRTELSESLFRLLSNLEADVPPHAVCRLPGLNEHHWLDQVTSRT